MFTSPGRVAACVAGVVALVVAAAVAYLLLAPRQTASVAVPPPHATPEQVVAAYLGALKAHDCDTAKALMTDETKSRATSWCEGVDSLTDVDVRDHVTERPARSGHSPPEEVADVPVTFDVTWRPSQDDGSMEAGHTVWGYLLVRESADAPWRIFDQGTG